ncbi:MAG: hypothetical protein JW889_08535 [Verrucomicrobia bacterium]|nr:hypothetical protein [Verrucomicrobiota bacterium]
MFAQVARYVALGVIAFATLVVIAITAAYRADRRRREVFDELADRLGFAFDPKKRKKRPPWSKPFELFRRGSPDGTFNHLAGERDGLSVEIFDYKYVISSGDSNTTYTRVVVVLEMPGSFPMLLVRPDTALREFFECLGGADIDFESHEFNRRFYVKAEDRAFAFQIVHAQMMEFLLAARTALRGISLQLLGDRAVFYRDKDLKPKDVGPVLEFALAFYARIPDFVKKDRVRTTS